MRNLLAAMLLILPVTVGAQVIPTNEWVNLWGDNCVLNANPVPVGAVVRAYDPDGVLCGEFTVAASGTYGLMPVYGDDPTTPGVDEGADPGDVITLTVDGVSVIPAGPDVPVWTGNGDLKKVNLFREDVIPTNEWVNFWSDSSIVNFNPLPYGSIVQAFDPDGVLCGEYTVTAAGTYGLMPVYRDDATTAIDEGAEPGDLISFRIDGAPAIPMGPDCPEWSSNGDLKKVNLLIGDNAPVGMVDPMTLDFGGVVQGTSKDMTFTIKNGGGGVLVGEVTADCGPHYSVVGDTVRYDLGAGDSVMVTLHYEPTAAGTHECEVETGNCLCAHVNASGHIVATLLQNYSTGFSEAGITITWVLSEIDDDVEFIVERASEPDGPFVKLPSSALSRDGLSFTFIDTELEPGTSYWYSVAYRRGSERKVLFEAGPVKTPAMPVALFQNHPNPFNPSTAIGYYLEQDCRVALEIYDIRGNLIARLTEAYQEKGLHTATWNGRDRTGNEVSSGVYFYRLKAGKTEISKKMVLAR